MALLDNDPATRLAFSMAAGKGVYALLLGSGVSRSAAIPTGWEIVLDLIRRVGSAKGVVDPSTDWSAWYKAATGKDPDYSDLLAELGATPAERRNIIHAYIEPTPEERDEGKKTPTPAHHAVARLVQGGFVKVIVTTNFDRLMEAALQEVGIAPTVIASPSALAGATPLPHNACTILKLHGDYLDQGILNTLDELKSYSPEYDALLDRIFDEYGLVVAGWSGDWDAALRDAFMRVPSRRYPVYWTARGGKVSLLGQTILDHRKAELIPVAGADEFFSDLATKVEVLDAAKRQDIRTTELLIARAKRAMPRPELRIELEDLVAAEAEALLQRLRANPIDVSQPLEKLNLKSIVDSFEAATEPFARLAGALARWGTEEQVALASGTLASLYRLGTEAVSGYQKASSLRLYPAVIVYYALGLGLTMKGNWQAIESLNGFKLEFDATSRITPSSDLFLWNWEAGTEEVWHKYPGLERLYAPLSQHLLDLFTAWGDPLYNPSNGIERIHFTFELLCSISYLHANYDKSQLRELTPLGYPTPVGRPISQAGFPDPTKEFEADSATRKSVVTAGLALDVDDLDLMLRVISWVRRRRF